MPAKVTRRLPTLLDALFFLDTPSSAEKALIWPIHLARYGLAADQPRPPDADWTGAEIGSCCRLAALLDLTIVEAARHVVPVAVSAAQAVERLRNWASGRCLDASRPGIYRREAASASITATAAGSTTRRRVSRPSSN